METKAIIAVIIFGIVTCAFMEVAYQNGLDRANIIKRRRHNK